ncbi:MAG: branched-chain amino acid ABC transporter permease [Pseudomonadota bacterium]
MRKGRFNHSFSSGFGALAICAATGLLWYTAVGGIIGLDQLTTYLILGLFALSVDFLWGYGGMLSFGQAAFFGLGSFSYSVITTGRIMAVPPEAGLIGLGVGVMVAIMLAMLLGYFLFYGRVTGPYFTIVTLALSFLMSSLALALPSLFGGWTGIANVPHLTIDFLGVSFGGPLSSFVLVTIMCAVIVTILRWILDSRFGLLVDGLRDNEERLEYLGTSIAKIQLTMFVISAAVGGFAGGFFAAQSGYVSPELLGVVLSTEAIVFVAVGGRRTLLGALIGAIVVRGVGYWLGGVALDYWQLFMGVMFIFVVLFAKGGLLGFTGYVRQAYVERYFTKIVFLRRI